MIRSSILRSWVARQWLCSSVILSLHLGLQGVTLHAKDTIIIEGQKRERYWPSRSSSQVTIKPSKATRYDTKAQLTELSSVSFVETGSISATGFAIPRLRGHELQQSEVFLGDYKLLDPLSSFAPTLAIDLRAFGVLDVFYGVSPADMASLNPVGGLRYRFQEEGSQSPDRLGFDWGRPYGQSLWSQLSQGWHSQGQQHLARLFVRDHRSSGHYEYYDDRGTPFNPSDDRSSQRINNQTESLQALPSYQFRTRQFDINALAWIIDERRGVPALNSVRESQARFQQSLRLLANQLRYRPFSSQPWVPDSLDFNVSHEIMNSQFTDPTRLFLVDRSETSYDFATTGASVGTQWLDRGQGGQDIYFQFSTKRSDLDLRQATAESLEYRRELQSGYVGGRFRWWQRRMQWDHKVGWVQSVSKRDLQAVEVGSLRWNAQGINRQQASSYASTLSASLLGGTVYSQFATYRRLPSLYELFGNGARTLANPDLTPETVEHYELGWRYVYSPATTAYEFRWRVAGFQDVIKDKIVFVPKFENALVADNLAEASIQGLELAFEWQWRHLLVATAASWLDPVDRSKGAGKDYQIPGVATEQGRVQLVYAPADYAVRLSGQHQGRLYRDSWNRREIPAHTLWDLGLDWTVKAWEPVTARLGLTINNLTDKRDLSVSSTRGELAQEGAIALSTADGYPLPGRTWKGSLIFEF